MARELRREDKQRNIALAAGVAFTSPSELFTELVTYRHINDDNLLLELVDTLTNRERVEYATYTLNNLSLMDDDLMQIMGLLLEMGGQPTQQLLDQLRQYKSLIVHVRRPGDYLKKFDDAIKLIEPIVEAERRLQNRLNVARLSKQLNLNKNNGDKDPYNDPFKNIQKFLYGSTRRKSPKKSRKVYKKKSVRRRRK